jgi:hypothetical protein
MQANCTRVFTHLYYVQLQGFEVTVAAAAAGI